jgi:DNA-binding FadR family transcriptional regulator
LEVLSARMLVEAEVAALAAAHASPTDIKAIDKALKTMHKEVRQGKPPAEGDVAFHLAVARASANGVLMDTVERYGQARSGPLFERLGDYFESPASWAAALSEHEEVFAAIAAHDPQRARKAMQQHLKQAHKRFSASWRSAPSRT